MLRLMVDSSSQFGIPRETSLMVTAWDERRRFGDLSDEDNMRRLADRMVEILPSATSRRLGVPPRQLHKRIMAAPPTLGSVIGTCLATYAGRNNKPRWGDKRPVYSRYLDAVFSMFPDAQFIHLVRDPRASTASMAQMWHDGRIAPNLELWERSMRAVEPWRARLAPDQFLELRYEDLVADPTGELKRVASFLTLEMSEVEEMLRFHEHPDETSPVHPNVRNPPTTQNIDKWRDSLTSEQTALIEHVTGDWMKRYGYEPAEGGAAPLSRALRTYHRRRRRMAKRRRVREREELRLMLTSRLDVTARLTSSQLAGASPPSMPAPWQRWIGRPA